MTDMHSLYRMPNPTIRVSGEVDGREVVMEATARSVQIDTQHIYEGIDTFLDSSKIFKTGETTTLSAELVDGWLVTLRDKPTYEVTRSARTEATDRSVAALEKARRAVGAPENAKVSMGYSFSGSDELMLENLDEARPIGVEFRWKETIYVND